MNVLTTARNGAEPTNDGNRPEAVIRSNGSFYAEHPKCEITLIKI